MGKSDSGILDASLTTALVRAARMAAAAAEKTLAAENLTLDHWMTLEALADVDAGRVIDHQAIQAWADSLGTDTPLPPPSA